MDELRAFLSSSRPWSVGQSDWYQSSFLSPVAPEQATAEVLLGGAYRKLVLGIGEADVDLNSIGSLPIRLGETGNEQAWESIFAFGGLGSPSTDRRELPQVMQLVPSLARYGGVVGKVRNRWSPGNLLVNAVQSGCPDHQDAQDLLATFAEALTVGEKDDLLAKFIERELSELAPPSDTTGDVEGSFSRTFEERRPARRIRRSGPLVPSERFVKDLRQITKQKEFLTRRQWTALVEALLRIGLFTHYSWLLKLNALCWDASRRVMSGECINDVRELVTKKWTGHAHDWPILEIGQKSAPTIKRLIREYAQARLGITLVLCSLKADGLTENPISMTEGKDAFDSVIALLDLVDERRTGIESSIAYATQGQTFQQSARSLFDRSNNFLNAKSGPTRNALFFLTYTAGRVVPSVATQATYDQSYLLKKRNSSTANSPWICELGPTMLVLLIHCCCSNGRSASTSLAQFERYLASWGIRVPKQEMQGGNLARALEQLGILVDSPDAGGGRLLIDPLPTLGV